MADSAFEEILGGCPEGVMKVLVAAAVIIGTLLVVYYICKALGSVEGLMVVPAPKDTKLYGMDLQNKLYGGDNVIRY